jgi:hypothetical protein
VRPWSFPTLVAIMKKRLSLDKDLYTILQILSPPLFEVRSLLQVLTDPDGLSIEANVDNQSLLFTL